jgi:hypothetical protein
MGLENIFILFFVCVYYIIAIHLLNQIWEAVA